MKKVKFALTKLDLIPYRTAVLAKGWHFTSRQREFHSPSEFLRWWAIYISLNKEEVPQPITFLPTGRFMLEIMTESIKYVYVRTGEAIEEIRNPFSSLYRDWHKKQFNSSFKIICAILFLKGFRITRTSLTLFGSQKLEMDLKINRGSKRIKASVCIKRVEEIVSTQIFEPKDLFLPVGIISARQTKIYF